jgi:hypothetical protein
MQGVTCAAGCVKRSGTHHYQKAAIAIRCIAIHFTHPASTIENASTLQRNLHHAYLIDLRRLRSWPRC